ELQRIDHAQDLVEVATCAHGIAELHFDFLVGANHEHGANRRVVVRSTSLRSVASSSGQHAVKLGDFELWVADHWIVHLRSLRFFDVTLPPLVIADRVNADGQNFRVALRELGLELCHCAQLRGAYGCEVFGMREQDGPSVADPVMEMNGALGCFGGEIRSDIVNAQNGSFGWSQCCSAHFPSSGEIYV